MAQTLRDAETAFLLESLPYVRAVHTLNPPTSEFDYIALVDRLGGAELADAHYRLLRGVGRERATRVWFVRDDPSSLPRALKRAVRVELDANDRELAARSIEARREKVEQERALHFRHVLAETIAWCRSGAAIAESLRTPQLRPGPFHDGARDPRSDRMSADWWRLTSADQHAEREGRSSPTTRYRMQAVAEVAANRARLLRELDLLPDEASADAAGGLLLWRPTGPRHAPARSPTGTARCETSGEFFDAFDCPPWDTWVSWEPRVQGGEALVSWVPPEWRLRAEAACAALGRPGVEWLRSPFFGVPGP